MRYSKIQYLFVLIASGLILFSSCADLSVDNSGEPTRDSDIIVEGIDLLSVGFYDATTAMVSSWWTHLHTLADQSTNTNTFRRLWDFSEEPRIRLTNSTNCCATTAISAFYGGFNSAITRSNLYIDNIVNHDFEISNAAGGDVTNDVLAQAYFLRGLSRGYLGMIYDQSYFMDENFDSGTEEVEFEPYTTLINGSLSDLDKAMELADSSTTFIFSSMPNREDSWTKEQFLDIVNSLAARIAAGQARTAAEAQNLDWGRILTYANAGLGGPNSMSGLNTFSATNIGSVGEYANYFSDWMNFVVEGTFQTGAGYLPTDVKVIHLLDRSYPTIYPADQASASEASLSPAESDDPRLDYFKYTTNPGYLDPARDANLFSNYFSARMFSENDWWKADNKIIFITSSEVAYLRAEAQLMGGGNGGAAAAAQTLNDSPAGTGSTDLDGFQLPAVRFGYVEQNSLSGGHIMDGTESMAEFQWALLREYSVELDMLGGVGIQWFFMRRHDLLQEGTATMFPVPGSELELRGMENYTFGGVNFAGQPGTASGANSWKNLAEAAFGPAKTKLSTVKSKAEWQQDYLLPFKVKEIPTPLSLGKNVRNN
ncbi:RagB/SusD family nutrient uptake outer membrane protein [Gracilimonas halophila]|uniref:Starch-binding associating with outer membrane n=1 Tax=Gracilimonas halophila TaxID=1834464 RepID=A0ABW5JGK4_9BACT